MPDRETLFDALPQELIGEETSDIFPAAIRSVARRLLWTGLFVALAALALVVVLIWGSRG